MKRTGFYNSPAVLVGVAFMVMTIALLSFWPATAFADDDVVVKDASGNTLDPSSASINGDGNVAVSETGTAALLNGAPFGISEFNRQNAGTPQKVDGVYYGYRYANAVGETAYCAIVDSSYVLIYIPQESLDRLGLDINDSAFQSKFLTTLATIDKKASEGGYTIVDNAASAQVYFTTSDTITVGEYTYSFGMEIDGRYYVAINSPDKSKNRYGALYMSTGRVTSADETVIVAGATGFEALQQFFVELDWRPLWVSLKTTGVAIIAIFILGLLAAWLTLRVPNKVKGVLDTIFTIPMVLPPTVCGFLLLMFFGSSSATGSWLVEHGIAVVFTWPAAVISCVVVGFPMMYRTVRGAFENIDANMLDAARTLGWREARIFSRIMMPLSWPSIAAGTVLAFARAMGEFGCTLFFAGNKEGVTQTIPLAIYFDWMGGKPDQAIFWAIVVILISFAVILFINIYSSKTQRYRKRLGE